MWFGAVPNRWRLRKNSVFFRWLKPLFVACCCCDVDVILPQPQHFTLFCFILFVFPYIWFDVTGNVTTGSAFCSLDHRDYVIFASNKKRLSSPSQWTADVMLKICLTVLFEDVDKQTALVKTLVASGKIQAQGWLMAVSNDQQKTSEHARVPPLCGDDNGRWDGVLFMIIW